MAEQWRRCAKCRKIKSVEDFDGDEGTCRACLAAPVRKAPSRAGAVTTRRAAPDAGAAAAPGVAEGQAPAPAVRTVAARDLRGRGDHEVRVRRARVRALDRLAEEYPDDFARLIAEERRSEGLS